MQVALQGYDLPGLQTLSARCNQAFERVNRVTAQCYPSSTALPLDHVAARLEQMAAGVWPHQDKSPLTNHTAVADALVQVAPTDRKPKP